MKARWRHGTIRGRSAAAAAPRTVVKVGGSLLGRAAWPDEIAALLAELGPAVLVVGGGGVVDGLRAIDAASPRPPALMHELAIAAMTLTARVGSQALGLPLVTDPLAASGVLDAAAWLRASASAAGLPPGWHVTSDSIAAAVARASAGDLVLVKSVPPPCTGDDLARLAVSGWVDRYFPVAAAAVAGIRWAAPA